MFQYNQINLAQIWIQALPNISWWHNIQNLMSHY